MKKRDSLTEFIKINKRICIYGAGDYAKLTYSKLKNYDVVIEAFVVTNCVEINELYSIPVLTYRDWKSSNYSRNIVVGVSLKNQLDIMNILNEDNIKSVYYVNQEDFVDNCISILDTSISDDNHGNEIIMDAVDQEINNLFSDYFITKLPYNDNLKDYGKNLLKRSKLAILGGTNALNSHMETECFIAVNNKNMDLYKNKIVLAGVGWYNYQDDPDEYTIDLLQNVLSKDYYHSVRDKYTENKLRSIGIENVITTGCLTTWGFDKLSGDDFSDVKGEDVIIMLTPFDRARDEKIIDFVMSNYKKIYYWEQSPLDSTYVKSLCEEAIKIGASLSSLDNFLESHESVDYIGTRLHGGIRAIQHKKRAYIMAIDNRAEEMGKDINLPIIHVDDLFGMKKVINNKYNYDISIPVDSINKWRNQF